ncbi:MAG: SAM-dependent chlorinase/fluorinase [Planctomycetes bacterium]|nr:SAM-dependent chlorinase/fluorinase [Planctomycetota bacterium]MCB9917820.1 SAM-dependent chlorinase/fluorinase [Planctomycetota bacterium]
MAFLPSGVVTLLSDLGLDDASVGILKGAMMSRFAQVKIVDICHSVPQKDVLWATYSLAGCYRDFPPGTVHCAIVGPGRGSATNVLVASRAGHIFVAPNNGCLSKIIVENETHVRCLDIERVPVAPIRRTYHTRDVVASVGALIASGKLGFEDVGDVDSEPFRIASLDLTLGESHAEGVVLGSDRFGNVFASINASDLPRHDLDYLVEIDGQQIPIVPGIHDAQPGKPAAMFNYSGMLQIVERDGRANERLNATRGTKIRVSWK